MVDATKLKDADLGQLLETLAIEAKTRSQQRHKELDNNEKEQVEFLNKCRSLVQMVILGPAEVDTDKPLEKAYQLFESMVSTLQAQIQDTKEEQKEETIRLLMEQHIAFAEAYKVLQDHMEESVIIEEVLRDWPAYYGQVYQRTGKTRQEIQALEKRKNTDEALRCASRRLNSSLCGRNGSFTTLNFFRSAA